MSSINNYQRFTIKNGGKQLTRWVINKNELNPIIDGFHKYHGKCYGREYIIKSNRKKRNIKWAIFIHKENKLRRSTDKEWFSSMIEQKGFNIGEMLLMIRSEKQEYVPLLKTLSNKL
jgi:hypothetical protein